MQSAGHRPPLRASRAECLFANLTAVNGGCHPGKMFPGECYPKDGHMSSTASIYPRSQVYFLEEVARRRWPLNKITLKGFARPNKSISLARRDPRPLQNGVLVG